jgi:hypothetical protein
LLSYNIEKGAPGAPFFIIAYFLPFGLALVAPTVDFFAVGAAFLAVAFVAILVMFISPSQRSGTLSTKKIRTCFHCASLLKLCASLSQAVHTNLLLFLFILNKLN